MIRGFQRVLTSRRGKLAAALLVALAIAGGAAAYYLSTGSGTGSASVGTLNPATISAPGTSGASITITWTAQASMSPPSQNSGISYTVQRKLGSSGTYSTLGSGSCGGSLPYNTNSCADTVTTNGTYYYEVIAHFGGNAWTATSNEVSTTATVDNSPPTTSISFPGSGFHSAANYNAGCSPTGTCGSANDATGVSIVRVSVLQASSGKYWDGSSFNNASETFTNATLASPGSTSTNWDLPLALPSDGSYTIHVQAKDTLGNDSAPNNTSSGTFSIDTTTPTTTDNTGTLGGGWFKTNQTVALSPSDVPGSGVAATYYTSGSPTASTPTTGSSQGTSVALNGDGVWQVKYFSVDNVGNTESVKTAGTTIHIDETPPIAGAVLTSGAFVSGDGTTYVKNGQVLMDTTTSDPTVNGASSGVASAHYWYCSSSCSGTTPTSNPGSWTSIGSSSTGSSYSVSWTSQPSDGTYSLIGGVTDNATNLAYTALKTVVVDNTKPADSLALAANPTGAYLANVSGLKLYYKGNASGSFKLTDTVADSGSGPASATFPSSTNITHSNQTVTAGSPNFTSSSFSWNANPGTPSPSPYTVTSTDNAGNTSNGSSFTWVNDSTAPTGGALATNATLNSGDYYSTSGTFTITRTDYTENQTTTQSGLASSSLTRQTGTWNSSTGTCGSLGSLVNEPSGNASESGLAEGCYVYTLTGTDNVGNNASTTATVEVDKTNPATTITINPSSTNGSNGWYDGSSPTFTLSASDTGGSGIATTKYQIDGGTVTTYPGSAVTIPDGQHTISYWSVDNAGNTETTHTTGTIKVDTVKPTNSLALGSSPSHAFLNGTTLYFKNNTAGSFALVNSVSDATSGPASATFPAVTATNWTHSVETVSAPSGGPYASSSYSWTSGAGTPSGSQATFTSADAAGNTSANTVLTFAPDITAPSGGSVSVPSFVNTATVPVTFDPGSDSSGSGINSASGQLSRATATYNSSTDTCGSFGSFTNIGSAGVTSPITDTTVSANTCYEYQYTVSDNVGNTATYTSGAVAYDTTAPTVSSVGTTKASGAYKAGVAIPITVTFSEPVTVTGTPKLALNTSPAESASYTSGSGTNTLIFTYTVQAGDNVAHLDYAATTSLSGGTITDAAANAATLTLPTPQGANDNLYSTNIAVDTTAPTGFSIASNPNPKDGKPNSGDQIIYTYSESMSPGSIMSGWNGTSTSVTAHFDTGGSQGFNAMTVTGTNLGSVDVGFNYASNHGHAFDVAATMAMTTVSGHSVITLTLTAAGNGTIDTGNTTLVWTPSSSATDLAGNACSTSNVTQSAPAENFGFSTRHALLLFVILNALFFGTIALLTMPIPRRRRAQRRKAG